MLVFSRLTQLIYLGALTARRPRKILANQLIHQSVLKEIEKSDPAYRPSPSLRYMTKLGK